MRRDSFNVLFFIKKTKLLKNGEASVCMRITVNGARVETNIRKSIEPVSWCKLPLKLLLYNKRHLHFISLALMNCS